MFAVREPYEPNHGGKPKQLQGFFVCPPDPCQFLNARKSSFWVGSLSFTIFLGHILRLFLVTFLYSSFSWVKFLNLFFTGTQFSIKIKQEKNFRTRSRGVAILEIFRFFTAEFSHLSHKKTISQSLVSAVIFFFVCEKKK
jgi:hypothetical protein